jgi:hypothetical protein
MTFFLVRKAVGVDFNKKKAFRASLLATYVHSYFLARVGGNQGRMVGRRLAVGFLQIVPGVFPTGVVTDRLRIHGLLAIHELPPSLHFPAKEIYGRP